MLSREGCLARREKLWEQVPERIEWLLVADPRHVVYLSNFWVEPLSFSAQERGLLLLERGGPVTLLADNFTRRSAIEPIYVDAEVIQTWYDHKHSVINRDHALANALGQVVSRLKSRRGWVETEALSVNLLEVLGGSTANVAPPSVSLGSYLRNLRRQKYPDELALLARCMSAGAQGLKRAQEFIRAGVSEFAVYREMLAAVLTATGRPTQIYGDFRATNASTPKAGGPPTHRPLEPGDLMIIDYSVVLHGYRSDFTNTFPVGEPSDAQRESYQLCQAAMAAGEQAVRGGAAARDVYQAVMSVFQSAGLGEFFPHHAGHGLGMEHPEPPILVPESTDELLVGDVITLEPGLYRPDVGGVRIEHNYCVTARGCDRLSTHSLGWH